MIREDGQPIDPRFPKHIVRQAEWDHWLDEDKEDVRLIDWGETFRTGEEPERLAQPVDCKAPETIFTDYLDYRTDLWRAGIVVSLCFSFRYDINMLTRFQIYHMVFGGKPFMAFQVDSFLVAQMINFVEDLPEEWKEQWLQMKEKSENSYDDIPGEQIIFTQPQPCFFYI